VQTYILHVLSIIEFVSNECICVWLKQFHWISKS